MLGIWQDCVGRPLAQTSGGTLGGTAACHDLEDAEDNVLMVLL